MLSKQYTVKVDSSQTHPIVHFYKGVQYRGH